MAIDSIGNIYVSGMDGASPPGFVTFKYNAGGQQLWSVRFAGMQGFSARPVKMGCDQLGDVYVGAYDVSLILLKYNTNGILLWYKRFNADYLTGLAITPSGFPIITGTALSGPPTNNDCYTVKCNPNGDTIWTATYNSPSNYSDWSLALALSNAGEVCITGYSASPTSNEQDFLTVKYDSAGAQQWAKTYGGSNLTDRAKDVVFDQNRNVFVTGYLDINNSKYCTIKYLPNGDTAWVKIYHNFQNTSEYPSRIKSDASGNVCITGGAYSSDTLPRRKYLTIKYDEQGNLLWENQISWIDVIAPPPEDMKIDNAGDIYVIGTSTIDFNHNQYQLYCIKYSSNGSTQFQIPYNTHSGGSNIIIDKNYHIYLNGNYSDTASPNGGILTLKYSQPIGIQHNSSNLPNKYVLSQNYPNPFNPSTTIKFALPNDVKVVIKIYDILGREVKILVNDFKKAGYYQETFDGTNLASGIYFYHIEAGTFIQSKKMVLVK